MNADLTGPYTGEMIRAGRALLRMSRKELAKLAGVALDTVKRLEETHGEVKATGETLTRLARAFASKGVSLRHDRDSSELIYNHPVFELEASPQSTGQDCGPDLYRITYISKAAPGIEGDLAALEEICESARRRNLRLGVTGALWLQDGHFLQSIEGPKSSLQALAGMLALDQRHQKPMVLEQAQISERLFPAWMICHPDRPTTLLGVPKLTYSISVEAALALLRSLSHSGED